MRCLLLLAFTGCYVAHTPVDTTRQIDTYTTSEIRKVDPLELHITEAAATIYVAAIHPRRCYRQVRAVFEHTQGTKSELVGPHMGLGGGGDPAALLLAVPVLLVAGAVAEGVRKEESTTERYEDTLAVLPSECQALAAQVGLDVSFPSGTTIHTSTDANGLLSLAIPPTEPVEGVVVLRAPGIQQAFGYSRDVAFSPPSANFVVRAPPPPPRRTTVAQDRAALEQQGFAAVREALRTCADRQGLHGLVAAQLVIDFEGRVKSNPDHGGPAFASCVNGALADVRFPGERTQSLVFPYQL